MPIFRKAKTKPDYHFCPARLDTMQSIGLVSSSGLSGVLETRADRVFVAGHLRQVHGLGLITFENSTLFDGVPCSCPLRRPLGPPDPGAPPCIRQRAIGAPEPAGLLRLGQFCLDHAPALS
jgi:hypothetical protein